MSGFNMYLSFCINICCEKNGFGNEIPLNEAGLVKSEKQDPKKERHLHKSKQEFWFGAEAEGCTLHKEQRNSKHGCFRSNASLQDSDEIRCHASRGQ